jgi:hypothetical protein
LPRIKEKFGGLRFCYQLPDGNQPETINDLIRHAEATAAHTCEICGANGRLCNHGWLQELCMNMPVPSRATRPAAPPDPTATA